MNPRRLDPLPPERSARIAAFQRPVEQGGGAAGPACRAAYCPPVFSPRAGRRLSRPPRSTIRSIRVITSRRAMSADRPPLPGGDQLAADHGGHRAGVAQRALSPRLGDAPGFQLRAEVLGEDVERIRQPPRLPPASLASHRAGPLALASSFSASCAALACSPSSSPGGIDPST